MSTISTAMALAAFRDYLGTLPWGPNDTMQSVWLAGQRAAALNLSYKACARVICEHSPRVAALGQPWRRRNIYRAYSAAEVGA